MAWSKEQLAAIESRGGDVLVSAAAGSGKTSVLVERVIRLVTDPAAPVDIDRLLVVTFTKAAADEMRSRVYDALAKAAAKSPTAALRRQLALISGAQISTLHSFCQSVVRQYFYLLGLDPDFRVAADAEAALLAADAMEELFEERYAAGDAAFLDLAERYGGVRGDARLQGLVRSLYYFSRSHPDPAGWLSGLAAMFELPAGAGVDATPWAKVLVGRTALEVAELRHDVEKLWQQAASLGLPGAGYADTLISDLAVLDNILAAVSGGWSAVQAAADAAAFGRLAGRPRNLDPDDATVLEQIKRRRQQIKKAFEALIEECFPRPAAEIAADLRQVAPQVRALAELVEAFAERFAARKRMRNVLDFNDLEHLCLRLLRSGPDAGKDSAGKGVDVAGALQERFVEVLVDEYQDINEVQEAILALIARPEAPNRFMVGDVKQSIYRFRLAEPGLFLAKAEAYRDGRGGRRIDLTANFRSRPEILAAVNFLFSRLMRRESSAMDYSAADWLNPGAEYPAAGGVPLAAGPVELYLVDAAAAAPGSSSGWSGDDGGNVQDAPGPDDGEDLPGMASAAEEAAAPGDDEAAGPAPDETPADLSRFEIECRLVARLLADLKAEGRQIYDRAQQAYRPLAWRDMAVLLRTVTGKAAILLEALREAGIPCYADLDAGYFQETEVQVMLALLAAIDNPRQDIPLAAVLRAPFVGFTAADLAAVRLAKPDGSCLWEALTAFAAGDGDDDDAGADGGHGGNREESRDGGGAGDGAAAALRQKARAFIARLEGWRSLARRRSVAELILAVYRDTGYYDYAAARPGGTIRQANLRVLLDRAWQFEATQFRGLFRFLRFIERLQERGTDLAAARAFGEAEDVVRIMSIHKSKGLEFPVVIVADLGKKFNFEDKNAPVVCHKQYGVGPYVIDPVLGYRYPTLARRAVQHALEMDSRAEELRVLYVALTRAREKLILVGTPADLARQQEAWQEQGAADGPLPFSVVGKGKTFLDWLGPALANAQGWREEAGVRVHVLSRAQIATTAFAPAAEEAEFISAWKQGEAVPGGYGTGWVAARLEWEYPWQKAVGKPAKLSVTEIKRRLDMAADDAAEHSAGLAAGAGTAGTPAWHGASDISAAEAGIAAHTVLQRLDLTRPLDAAGIAAQAREMAEREIITRFQAKNIDTGALAAFFRSPLGQRLLASPKVRREMPFGILMPAEDPRLFPELAGQGETVFVQGVVDCLFDEDDGLVLIDYKTDHVQDGRELCRRYAVQLALYAAAVERILRRRVKEKYIYALALGEAIKVD